MTKSMKTIWALFAVSFLASCLLFTSLSFGQEMPKPGEVIDKSNYKKYAHLFPEEFLPGFENGWDLIKPIHVRVIEPKSYPIPKVFWELSLKNRGKFSVDANGYITGGFDQLGIPFPEVALPGADRNDKDFAMKLMWNWDYKYIYDSTDQVNLAWEKRRGESLKWNLAEGIWVNFINRMVNPPKPFYKTPIGLRKALLYQWREPPSMKNLNTLNLRYLEYSKTDDIYIYLPSLRRVLRGEAGQRSTPLVGLIQAIDDFNGFDGRIPEFTYEVVKEQKVLGIAETKMNPEVAKGISKTGEIPFSTENWEVRDVYVIDIKPKDPKYPQGRKRLYLDKENLTNPYYVIVWDRAGKLWKLWMLDNFTFQLPGGDRVNTFNTMFGLDLQFGMATTYAPDFKFNDPKFTYSDITPSALLKLGR